MADYCAETDIESALGITIDENSIPSSDEVSDFITRAQGMINAEAKVSSDMTDTYGELKSIAIDLVLKMVNNMWSYRYPDVFPYLDIELTSEQKRIIHKAHHKFAGKSWELGG